jgi:HD-GYP domain-containing protein (c-di-GMP phosphodiesterase class II)
MVRLARGGFRHDVGTLATPDAILLTRGPLDVDQYTVITTHSVIGDRLCRDCARCGVLRGRRRADLVVAFSFRARTDDRA